MTDFQAFDEFNVAVGVYSYQMGTRDTEKFSYSDNFVITFHQAVRVIWCPAKLTKALVIHFPDTDILYIHAPPYQPGG